VIGAGAICAALTAPAQAQLQPGDIVVADEGAQTVFKVDPTTGAVSTLATSAQFSGLFGVAIDSEGNVVVADRNADPAGLGGQRGAIFRFTPGQAPVTLATSLQFSEPRGVAIDSQGNVLVADEAANPAGLGGTTGAIFRFAPGEAPVALATSAQFRNPFGVALDAEGRVVVVDENADPAGLAINTGAIFRFAPGEAPAALATSAQFEAPFGLALDAQGNVLVADFDADPAGLAGNTGAIFRFAPGQAPAALATSPLLVDPAAIALDARGNVLVSDQSASGGDGAIFRFAPGDTPVILATSAAFTDPAGVAVVPPKCFGRFATIVGDDNANVLRGSPENDVIWGGRGKDKLIGRGGSDRICGETGKDRLLGGKGKDRLNGGKGRDKLVGGKGRDVLKGGKGRDELEQ